MRSEYVYIALIITNGPQASRAVCINRFFPVNRCWAAIHHCADIERFVKFLKSCASGFRGLRVVHDASLTKARDATRDGDQFFGLCVEGVGSEACVMKLLECGGGFWGHWGGPVHRSKVNKIEIRGTVSTDWLRTAEDDRGWDHCLRNLFCI